MRKEYAGIEKTLVLLAMKHGESCWPWPGHLNVKGYGTYTAPKGHAKLSPLAHRAAYELLIGRIPSGWNLDHRCENKPCCNPFHLDVVLCGANTLRGNSSSALNARKTHCVNGHPFDEMNTAPRDKGARRCKTCARDNGRRRYHLRKLAGAA